MIDYQRICICTHRFLLLVLIGTLISCVETKEKKQEDLRPNIR